jgi:accessory Sec system glycosyltransferase GtfB
MKINIFDRYDENTQKLMKSLSSVGVKRKNLFVHYDGELPTGGMSPFSYFIGVVDEQEDCKGLFFDQVTVPDFYDIRHLDGGSAAIEFLKDRVGIIHYRKQGYRLVDTVDWFSKSNSNVVIKRDHYNLSGFHYASTYFNEKKAYKTDYYNSKNQVIVSEDLISRSIKLTHQSKRHYFDNLTQFFLYFLKIIKMEVSNIYINSLSFPLFISRSLNIGKRTTLFWQESLNQEVPGNMKNELENAVTLKRIIFAKESQLKQVKESFPKTTIDLNYLSPIGEFIRVNQYRPKAFILTNSDNIYGLQDILTNFPELQISVAAYTNMSTKLLHLEEEYTNIQLIPSISEEELNDQLKNVDIYLDINRGLKVGEILKWAYQQNMLIFSYKEVAQLKTHGLIFDEVRDLCNHLSYILTDRANWQKLLMRMIEKDGHLSTLEDYQTILDLKS